MRAGLGPKGCGDLQVPADTGAHAVASSSCGVSSQTCSGGFFVKPWALPWSSKTNFRDNKVPEGADVSLKSGVRVRTSVVQLVESLCDQAVRGLWKGTFLENLQISALVTKQC